MPRAAVVFGLVGIAFAAAYTVAHFIFGVPVDAGNSKFAPVVIMLAPIIIGGTSILFAAVGARELLAQRSGKSEGGDAGAEASIQPPQTAREILASRLAVKFRMPIAAVGAASGGVAALNLTTRWVSNELVTYAAVVVASCAAVMFCCATFDPRFQRALSALNAQRRAKARELGSGFGLPLPTGDRLLFFLGLALLVVTLAASNSNHARPAAVLAFSGFFLVGISQMALMVRGYPTDRYIPPFS